VTDLSGDRWSEWRDLNLHPPRSERDTQAIGGIITIYSIGALVLTG
jgi:hypothetical protein